MHKELLKGKCMLTEQQAKTLIARVDQQTKLAAALLQSLDEEKRALTNRDRPQIEACATQKLALMSQLETLEQNRCQELSQWIPGVNPRQMSRVYAHIPKEQQPYAAKQFRQLRQSLRACARQNQINGAIIHVAKQFTQRVLATLRGQTNLAPDSPLYGPNGQAFSAVDTQSAIKA